MVLLLSLPLLLLGVAPAASPCGGDASAHEGFAKGFDTIVASDLEQDARTLASPDLEGRDTPSLGLERAAQWIEDRFAKAGLEFAPDSSAAWKEIAGSDPGQGTFRRPFQRRLAQPDASGCSLSLVPALVPSSAQPAIEPALSMELGRDFVPVHGCEGEAEGELVFAGYGIVSKSETYDDLAGLKLKGRIALIVAGEPRNERRFDGADLSPAASLWEKVDALGGAGVVGVLVVRRPGTPGPSRPERPGDSGGAASLPFRYAWAEFNGVAPDPPARRKLPVLEVSMRCAEALLGVDVEALAAKIDKSVHPVRASGGVRRVHVRSQTTEAQVRIDNLVGLVRGSDPSLSGEYVVVGAHYDHVGVDPRGRIACGADDNASGVAAMLEIAEALASARPRRSVLCCAFAGEEKGLLGSRAFCASPPVAKDRMVAMINLDMIGRGDAAEVAVIGIVQNPAFEKVLLRARKLKPCGLREIVMRQGEDLFGRSDHFAFHQIGVPALFFFEGLPIERNKDYHTWRDTVDKLDFAKMLNTTKLVYNATWILTDDDERVPPPLR